MTAHTKLGSSLSIHHKKKQTPKWIDDKAHANCTKCAKRFTVFSRRHHCRSCGTIICTKCSVKTPLIYHEYTLTRPKKAAFQFRLGKDSVPEVSLVSPKKYYTEKQATDRKIRCCSDCSNKVKKSPPKLQTTETSATAVDDIKRSSSPAKKPEEFLSNQCKVHHQCTTSLCQDRVIELTIAIGTCVLSLLGIYFTLEHYSYQSPIFAIFVVGLTRGIWECRIFIPLFESLYSSEEEDPKEAIEASCADANSLTEAQQLQEIPVNSSIIMPPRTRDEHLLVTKADEIMNKVMVMCQPKEGCTQFKWDEEVSTLPNARMWSSSPKNHSYGIKLFKCEAELPFSPKQLFDTLHDDAETSPQWNKTLVACKILRKLNDRTEIWHTVTAEHAGGLVSSRDFVTVRYWRSLGAGGLMTVSVSLEHLLPTKMDVELTDKMAAGKCTRGINGPGGFILLPVDGSPNACRLIWVIHSDLKGWIPRKVIDQTLTTAMRDLIVQLQLKCKEDNKCDNKRRWM